MKTRKTESAIGGRLQQLVRPPRHHILKTWPEYFDAIGDRRKTFEARCNDRDFQVGDSLELREWNPETQDYTQRWIWCRISYVLNGGKFGVQPGWAILGLNLPNNHPTAANLQICNTFKTNIQ